MIHPFITACVSALFSISSPTPDTTYTVAMVGDIMLGGVCRGGMAGSSVMEKNCLPPHEGKQLFTDVANILQCATLALGNYEGVLADSGRSAKEGLPNAFAFRTPTKYAQRLVEAGFDFLSLANNHSFDYGRNGLLSTQTTLQAHNIAFAGTKETIAQAPFAIVERNGVRFGICAFGHNISTLSHLNDSIVRAIVTATRQASDIVVVSFHGGAEGAKAARLPAGEEHYFNEKRGNLRHFARLAIDLGADLVFGHGPHVPRALELYNDRLIAYSLGNFCTPFGMNLNATGGLAPLLEVKVAPNGRFVGGRIHSFRQRQGSGPRRDETYAAAKEMARLTALDSPSFALRITTNGSLRPSQSIGGYLLTHSTSHF